MKGGKGGTPLHCQEFAYLQDRTKQDMQDRGAAGYAGSRVYSILG